MKTLYFQQITDSRFTPEADCLPLLEKRIEQIKHRLNIDGISVSVGKPVFIKWTGHIQYRVDVHVQKRTNKATWNDVYKIVNSVNAAPYRFI